MGGMKENSSVSGGDLNATMPFFDYKSKQIKHNYISSCDIQSEQFNSYVKRCLPGQRLSKYGPLMEIRTETKIIDHLMDLQCTICNIRIPLSYVSKAITTCRQHAASHTQLNVWECICCDFNCRTEMEICAHIRNKHDILEPTTLKSKYKFVVADSDEHIITSCFKKCFPTLDACTKPLNCMKCSYRERKLPTCHAMLDHVEKSHNNKSLMFKCSACDYESSKKKYVFTHAKKEHAMKGRKVIQVEKSVESKWISTVMECFPDHIPYLMQKYSADVAKVRGKMVKH